jgi:hypothetical protein
MGELEPGALSSDFAFWFTSDCLFHSDRFVIPLLASDHVQYLARPSSGWVRPLRFPFYVKAHAHSSRRYATARVDNLCEDWAGDYYPIEGQDPNRIYVQPFCTTEYHPKPHAHGIYAGPYSLRRRCMGGLGAHRLVAPCSRRIVEMVMLGRFSTGDGAFGKPKRGARG